MNNWVAVPFCLTLEKRNRSSIPSIKAFCRVITQIVSRDPKQLGLNWFWRNKVIQTFFRGNSRQLSSADQLMIFMRKKGTIQTSFFTVSERVVATMADDAENWIHLCRYVEVQYRDHCMHISKVSNLSLS